MSSRGLIFCQRLAQAVKADGRSVKAIARHSGYSEAYLLRLIHGHRTNPSLECIEVMALTLGRSIEWLIGLTDTDNYGMWSAELRPADA